ncbi:glycosyltransferase [Candidatus Kaiserbacteria bacterium]|nr:glycosyltransferase [Candidatus Kaiserbacteria bacterium]
MRVLMISGDPKAIEPNSAVSGRLALQKAQVDVLDVFVWPQVHSWREIFLAAKKNKYDVVTAQDPFWRGLLAWRIARRVGIKLNLQIHTDISQESFMKKVLARFLLPKANSVRVVSGNIKEYLTPLHLHAHISVLPIYVDLAPFRGLPHKPHPRFKKTILWVGRFEKEKDPLLALSILKDIRDSDIDAGLIMLGAGSLEHEIKKKAEKFALPVEFLGWKNPAQYLEMADVVISTSLFESYGASIIEALAAGVPVVSLDVGIAREAGAIVVPKNNINRAVIEALTLGKRGELKLKILDKEEWAKRWRETLL